MFRKDSAAEAADAQPEAVQPVGTVPEAAPTASTFFFSLDSSEGSSDSDSSDSDSDSDSDDSDEMIEYYMRAQKRRRQMLVAGMCHYEMYLNKALRRVPKEIWV